MARPLPPALQRFLDKFSKSRDFTISFVIHAILAVFFGGTVLYQVAQEPPEIKTGFVKRDELPKPPSNTTPPPPSIQQTFDPPTQQGAASAKVIQGSGQDPIAFELPAMISDGRIFTTTTQGDSTLQPAAVPTTDVMSKEQRKVIKDFSDLWEKKASAGKVTEFEFTAYIGQYQGGDWSSTVRVEPDGKIQTGSLPNLLYLMSYWSKDKIKTNYKNVQSIRLDSDEIFTVKPPFIFMTGTEDFTLTDKEVLNLQKYIYSGGCIWGDSSVPGLRSRFDLAFRREMKRVLPDIDKSFEPLSTDHPLFTKAYFPQIKAVPAGLNFYQLPVYAMKTHGEIAILYTANDYGDMWQLGLNSTGQIDLSQDAMRRYVAVNIGLYSQRGVYARNLTPESLTASYRFGTNLVIHLLTRWDDKVGRSTSSL